MIEYNILYVDDEQANLNSLKSLYRRKFNILTALSGKEGLNILETHPISVVITDQRMNHLSGIEFLTIAKDRYPDVKYILLTAFSDNDVIKKAVNDIGLYWYLNKPYDPKNLEIILAKALESYYSEKENRFLNEKFQMILATALDAIITINDTHQIVMVNPAVIKMFGFLEDELIGQNLSILIPQNIRNHEQLINEFGKSEVISKTMKTNNKIFGKCKSGKLIPIETNLSKMELNGKLYYNAVVRDISEKLESQKLLYESEMTFRSIFEGSQSGILLVNLKGEILKSNKRFRQMFGFTQNELLKIAFKDLSHPDYSKDSRKGFKKLKAGKIQSFEIEKKYIKKDGDEIMCHVMISTALGNDKEPMFFSAMINDITERKIAEQQIAKSEEKFRGVFESITDVFVRRTFEGKIIMASPSVFEVTGYTAKEIINQNIPFFFVDPELPKIILQKLLKDGGVQSFEPEIIKKDGSVITIFSNAKLFYDSAGNPVGIESIFRDITENKIVERKILESQQKLKDLTLELTITEEKMRKQIATDLHDDVGQLLSSSRMQLAAIDFDDDAKLIKKKIKNISQSLLLATKATRELIFNLSPPQLNEIGLYAAIHDWMKEEIEKKYSINTSITGDKEIYDLNENTRFLLFRSIRELLINVIKHAQASVIKIILINNYKSLVIVVKDDGIGFDYDGEKSLLSGIGFGLFSIQERISNIGGTMTIVSRLNIGTEIKLIVPSERLK